MDSVHHTKKTILLVEDEIITAAAEAHQLENEGYAVIQSLSGEEAIQIVESNPDSIDLILMDIDLSPGMDGTEAAREILKKHDIPVVFLSLHTEKDIVDRTEKITSYGYVIKNSGLNVLLASIKMAFKLYKANRQLRMANEHIAAVFRSCPDTMTLSRISDGLIFDVNDAFTDLTGFSREEAVGRAGTRDLGLWVNPEDRTRLMIELRKTGRVNSSDIPIRLKDGSVIEAQMSASLITYCNESCVILDVRDLTEKKRKERLIRESEEQYRRLFENSVMGIFQTTPEGKIISVNPAFVSNIGYDSPDDLIAHAGNDISRLYANPADRAGFINMIVGEESLRQFECEFRRKDGGTVFGLVFIWPVYDADGTLLRFEGSASDISKRKQAEEKLNTMLRQMNDIIEFLPDPTFVIDQDRKVVFWNSAMEQMSGVKKEDMLGQGDYAYAVPFYGERRPLLIDLFDKPTAELKAIYNQVERDMDNIAVGAYFPHANQDAGVYLWAVAKPLIDAAGRQIGAIEVIRDVTEHMRVEEQLRASEAKYRRLHETMRDAFLGISLEGRILEANSSFCGMVGYREDELRTMTYEDLTPRRWHELERTNKRRQVLTKGSSDVYEKEFRRKDGTTIPVEIHAFLVRDDKGKPEAMWAIVRDISGRKRAEEALQESEERFSKAFKSSPAAIAITEIATGRFIDVNEKWVDLIGYTAEEMIGRTTRELGIFTDWKDREKVVVELTQSGSVKEVPYGVITKSGEIRNVLWSLEAINLRGREVMLSLLTDVTERHRVEEQLKQTVREKEILMKELQHRVKNNMGIIASLLSLEMNNLADDRSQKIFRDAISRINSITSIYEQLVGASDIQKVVMDTYIQKLTSSLLDAYTLNGNRVNITMHCDAIKLDVKRAVPIGLILNELITNALKYAFPAVSSRAMNIEFRRDGESIVLLVSDNGIGLPDTIRTGNARGMGLQLIEMLTKQIGGKLLLESRQGTTARVTFSA